MGKPSVGDPLARQLKAKAIERNNRKGVTAPQGVNSSSRPKANFKLFGTSGSGTKLAAAKTGRLTGVSTFGNEDSDE